MLWWYRSPRPNGLRLRHTRSTLTGVTASSSCRYADDGTFTLTDHAGVVISNEDDVVRLVNGDPSASTPTVISIQDDYKWWKAAGYQPSAGKPLWITENDRRYPPLFAPIEHQINSFSSCTLAGLFGLLGCLNKWECEMLSAASVLLLQSRDNHWFVSIHSLHGQPPDELHRGHYLGTPASTCR